jgi:hypothetical protein
MTSLTAYPYETDGIGKPEQLGLEPQESFAASLLARKSGPTGITTTHTTAAEFMRVGLPPGMPPSRLRSPGATTTPPPPTTTTPPTTCPNQGDKVLEELVSLILGEGIVRRAKFCTWAARKNKEHLLKYLMAQGYAYGACTCEAVARNGNVELLKYLRDNNCRWTSSTTRAAANACQLGTLKFAVENGCRWVQQEEKKQEEFRWVEQEKWVSDESDDSEQ